MLTAYLVPAGPTNLSPNGELLGINNPPLSKDGTAYADRVADSLRPLVLEAVFAGPLSRQYATAQRIALPHSMPVRIEKDLIDINYGSWSGRTWRSIEKDHRQLFEKLRKAPHRFRFPSGEKVKKSARHVRNFSTHLLGNFGTGNIVIVGDDLVLMILASQISRVDFAELEPWKSSRGEITILECEPGSCSIKTLRGIGMSSKTTAK